LKLSDIVWCANNEVVVKYVNGYSLHVKVSLMKHQYLLVLFSIVMMGVHVPAVAQSADSLTEIIDYFSPQPELIGGVDSLRALVVYSDSALKLGIEGSVFVRLIAQADGSASDVEIIRGLGHGLDEEAVRVVRKARFKWPDDFPEELERRVVLTLPITFKLPASK